MELLIVSVLFGLLLLGLVALIWWLTGLIFEADSYQPRWRNFFTFLLVLIGLSWLFGGDDDGDC